MKRAEPVAQPVTFRRRRKKPVFVCCGARECEAGGDTREVGSGGDHEVGRRRRLFWPRVYAQVYLVSSQRAKPDLAIWAHQARQISGQALEAFRRGKLKPACSSHLPHSTLYSDYVSCFRAHSAPEYRTFVPTRVVLPGRQKLGLVEAQNFVPYIWAPGTEGASGATGYSGSQSDPLRPVFVVGKGEREVEGR